MPSIQPTSITPEQFMAYNAAWKKMVNGAGAGSLRNYFASSGGLINYVYLPVAMANAIMVAEPVSIALGFVLMPGSPTATFSMVVAGVDSNNYLKTPCYLAGVGGRAAVVTQPGDYVLPDNALAAIPFEQAADWINAFNALSAEGLGTAQFDSGFEAGRLCGYDYPLNDFTGALSGPQPANAALWFNFVLHPSTPQFSTVLTMNSVPTETNPGTIILSSALAYYDVALPCPPRPPFAVVPTMA
ncbi:MAG: hypothetical protein M3Y54_08330 [Bacteroidota bacterium]|nr:hypothetical protein [Bacteroidota bacterium]